MHKPTNRTRLTLTDSRDGGKRPRAPKKTSGKKRGGSGPRRLWNRRWNRPLQLLALALFLAEAGVLLLAYPALRVTQVRVQGAETLTTQQVFEEAQVPSRTNIFWMLRQPLTRRLEADPVIDHASRRIELPHRLVLTVAERRPWAVLAGDGAFWLLDKKGVPYRQLDGPLPGVPLVQAAAGALPETVVLGRPLGLSWLPDAYRLLALVQAAPALDAAKITVDQNRNLCLNSKDRLQIRLGQPDALPLKVALAAATVTANGGALARTAAYIDVSCPRQPVFMPRKDAGRNAADDEQAEPEQAEDKQAEDKQAEDHGTQSRTD